MSENNGNNSPAKQSDLEDSLGSALASSFSVPPRPPAVKAEPLSAMAAASAAAAASGDAEEKDEEPQVTAAEEEIPGVKEWKDTYEGYLKAWHTESAENREKALKTREKYEKEQEEAEKAAAAAAKEAKKIKADQEKKAKDEKKLREEIEGKQEEETVGETKEAEEKEERDRKVKEAWELVKEGGDDKATEPKEVETKQSTEASAAPQSTSSSRAPADSQTLSRQSDSQTWEQISGPSSSGSQETTAEDLVEIPRPGQAAAPQTPPAAPPSLTLSLFTMPSHLSISRVFAVLGINLVLPFINGVMLGFGEIFAREVVRVGRTWYRQTGSIYDQLFGGRRQPGAGGQGARGVSGVGLSGAGGF